MAKNTFSDFSETAADNTDIASINIQGSAAVSNFDNAFRTLMAILRRDLDNGMALAGKGANYTALAVDNNAVLRFSGAYTLSLTAAATLGAGWHCWVMADGGAVIIDPDGSETINGATTTTLPDGYSTLIICDGSGFRATEDYTTVAAALATLTTSVGTKVAKAGDKMTGNLEIENASPAVIISRTGTGAKRIQWVLNSDGRLWLQDVASGDVLFYVGPAGGVWSLATGDLSTALAAKSEITTVVGISQSWQNVSGSRAANTSYQNSTGKPIEVCISAASSGGSTQIKSGASVGSLAAVAITGVAGSYSTTVSFIVPDTHYYKVDGAASIALWSELRA